MTAFTARTSRRVGTTLLASAAALTMALSTTPASAATIDVDYDVNGTTTIESTGSDISLGPAVISTMVEEDGSVVADLDLPGTRTQFKAFGFIPVTADVNFEAVDQTTGQLTRVGRQRTLESTSTYFVRLSNIKAGFVFPLFAGKDCRTVDPVVIDADTPDGEFFDIGTGGRLTGEYSIGDFENCGLSTGLINLLVPGDDNMIELNLTDGRLN